MIVQNEENRSRSLAQILNTIIIPSSFQPLTWLLSFWISLKGKNKCVISFVLIPAFQGSHLLKCFYDPFADNTMQNDKDKMANRKKPVS